MPCGSVYAMYIPCQCHAWHMPYVSHVYAMLLTCVYHVNTMSTCHVYAMWTCVCHVYVMLLPFVLHVCRMYVMWIPYVAHEQRMPCVFRVYVMCIRVYAMMTCVCHVCVPRACHMYTMCMPGVFHA